MPRNQIQNMRPSATECVEKHQFGYLRNQTEMFGFSIVLSTRVGYAAVSSGVSKILIMGAPCGCACRARHDHLEAIATAWHWRGTS